MSLPAITIPPVTLPAITIPPVTIPPQTKTPKPPTPTPTATDTPPNAHPDPDRYSDGHPHRHRDGDPDGRSDAQLPGHVQFRLEGPGGRFEPDPAREDLSAGGYARRQLPGRRLPRLCDLAARLQCRLHIRQHVAAAILLRG